MGRLKATILLLIVLTRHTEIHLTTAARRPELISLTSHYYIDNLPEMAGTVLLLVDTHRWTDREPSTQTSP